MEVVKLLLKMHLELTKKVCFYKKIIHLLNFIPCSPDTAHTTSKPDIEINSDNVKIKNTLSVNDLVLNTPLALRTINLHMMLLQTHMNFVDSF